MLTEAKYLELFPTSSYSPQARVLSFGEYAQTWLNSREVVKGSRQNYKSTLNTYWMPKLAARRLDEITTVMLRNLIAETKWPSANRRRVAIQHLRYLLNGAVNDGEIQRNPATALELPKQVKKIIDPFDKHEAERIIERLYSELDNSMLIYAAYFEFAFFTGMRPGEIAALQWDEIDTNKRVAHVCRIVVEGEIAERTKTNGSRLVLLNNRALHALEVAREMATYRAKQDRRFPESRFVFPPAKRSEFIGSPMVTARHFRVVLRELGIRDRPQYNTRHTYATMCLMAGMNPAFIARQLGHSVKILLERYARWLDSSTDWAEIDKLENTTFGTKVVRAKQQGPAKPQARAFANFTLQSQHD